MQVRSRRQVQLDYSDHLQAKNQQLALYSLTDASGACTASTASATFETAGHAAYKCLYLESAAANYMVQATNTVEPECPDSP